MSGWKDLWEDIVDARNIDFTYLQELFDHDFEDELIINDISTGTVKKITRENLFPDFVLANDGSLTLTVSGGFTYR